MVFKAKSQQIIPGGKLGLYQTFIGGIVGVKTAAIT
jgi:hypothetical protein